MPLRKLLAISPTLMDEVTTFRFANRINTQSEALRRLIEQGLRAATGAPPPRDQPRRARRP